MMKPYQFILSIFFLFFASTSCTNIENPAPSIKGYLNGAEVKEIKVKTGSTVSFKYEIKALSNLSKVEVFVRRGIGLLSDSQLFLRKEAATGDLDGATYTVEGTLIATTDLMISVGAIDSDGNITTYQLNALLEISEFDDLVMMDAKSDGTSKTFLNTSYGLLLFAANAVADPSAIDFGFIYIESNPKVKASIVSFNDFGKTNSYPIVGQNNITLFKKAQAYVNTDAATLKQAYDLGTPFLSAIGIDEGKAAFDLKDGDVIAFKTQREKYGLILVKSVDRKNDASNNEQTIKIKLVVQK